MRPVVLLLLGALGASASRAQPVLVEHGFDRGIEAYSMAPVMGGGVAAVDVDEDGDVDLFVPNAENVSDQLYLNDGTGSFVESAATTGLAFLKRSRSALFFDADDDHDLDLVVAGDCFGSQWSPEPGNESCRSGIAMLRLYRQESGGSFTDVSAASGLAVDSGAMKVSEHRGGLAAGDLDDDGDLDLYVALWQGRSQLFRNDGDGNFTEVGAASGPGLAVRGHWQPVIADFNADGLQDIFVSIDFSENELWINQGGWVFLDRAVAAGVGSVMNDMGATLADYDNDGDFDLFCTNIYEDAPGERNVLFRNDSVGSAMSFAEVGATAGVADTDWGWGSTFFDVDNDGDLDLAVTNGFGDPPQYLTDTSRLFRNDGGPGWQFTDISTASGFDDTYWGSSLAAFDSDRDGDLDLVQTTKIHPAPGPLRLLENSGVAGMHHLVVRPRQRGRNHFAVGAVVEVTSSGTTQTRRIDAGGGFLAQEPFEATFGLGGAAQVEIVRVRWPGEGVSVWSAVPSGGVLEALDVVLLADGFETGTEVAWSAGP